MKKFYRKILAGNKYIIFSNVTERIFFFIVFLIIARKYPSGQFGELVTVFSLANIFIILFDFGLPVLLQREMALNKNNASAYFSNSLIFNLILFPFFILVNFIFCSIFFPEINAVLILTVSLLVYVFSLSNLLIKALSGLSLFRSQFVSILFSRSFILLLLILSLFFPSLTLIQMLLILLTGAFFQFIILFKHSADNNLKITLSAFKFNQLFSILKISMPLGLAVIFNLLYDKIDIILISAITNFDETAFYNIGYGVYKSSTIVFSFIFISGFTRISYLNRNKKAVRLFFKKYFIVLLWICIPLTIILFTFSDTLINLIYTSKYENASDILKILSFAVFGLALNNLTGIILNGLGLYKQNMIITLIGLIINVILNIIFIPEYGIIAAAAVTVITEYFIFAGDYYFIRKHLKTQSKIFHP